jgi:site-specific recombinase XerD
MQEPSQLELELPTRPLQLEDLPILENLGHVEGETLTLERSLKGWRLKNPVDIRLDKLLGVGEKGVAEYIIKSFIAQRPVLIPWVLDNLSLIALGRYLLRSKSGSLMGFYGYTNTVSLYCRRLNASPDSIIDDVKPDGIHVDPDRLLKHRRFLERCVSEMQDREPPVSPGRIEGYVRQVRTFYNCNGVEVPKPQLPRVRTLRKDRAPLQQELLRILDIAPIREKVIITALALSGMREGTLCQLRYHHVKEDLVKGRVPLHIHIDSEITKGKYADYDSFLNEEAVDMLRLYLDTRKAGTKPQWRKGAQVDYMPAEQIDDDSPLLRDTHSAEPRPIGEKQIYKMVHELYHRAGLLTPGPHGGWDLRVHSLRKFFKTNMKALGVDSDYVDYMMGHVVDTYHDIQSKGVEHLRNIYARANLRIRPQTKLGKLDVLKEFARGLGMDPEKILLREAFTEPQMAYIDPTQQEIQQVQQISRALMRRFVDETNTQPLHSSDR